MRRLTYTTNAIEDFNRQLRKVTQAKLKSPTDDSPVSYTHLDVYKRQDMELTVLDRHDAAARIGNAHTDARVLHRAGDADVPVPVSYTHLPQSGQFRRAMEAIPDLYAEQMPRWDMLEMDPLLDSSNMTVHELSLIHI